MTKKRVPIWAIASVASLCVVSVVLVGVLLFLVPFISTAFGLSTLKRGIEYPPQVLDGNEDDLADLNVVGLPLASKWEYQASAPIDRPPLFYANHVVLKGDKTIWSVQAISGEEEWYYESSYRIASSHSGSIHAVGDVVLFQRYPWPSQLHAIDLATGNERWETQSIVRGLTFDAKSRLFIASTDNYQALDAESGKLLWISDVCPSERGESTVFYDSYVGELYGWNDSSVLVVLDGDSGVLRRQLPELSNELLEDAGSIKIARNGVLYIERLYPESLLAVNGREESVLWAEDYSPRDSSFSPLLYEDNLYIKTVRGTLLAANRYTGSFQWEYPSSSSSSTSLELLSNLVALDNIVYGIFSDAKLRGFDPLTGQEIGHIQFVDVVKVPYTNLTVPGLAASDNMLFVSLGKTKLYAFEVIP
jgi:outer membrane protein assembly factor BamB